MNWHVWREVLIVILIVFIAVQSLFLWQKSNEFSLEGVSIAKPEIVFCERVECTPVEIPACPDCHCNLRINLNESFTSH